jgi:hypothetical protein
MPKKRLDVNWDREVSAEDVKPALKKYSRYLEENGLTESTISSYVYRAGKFLEFAQIMNLRRKASQASKKSSTIADCHEAQSIITVLRSKSTLKCAGSPSTSILLGL